MTTKFEMAAYLVNLHTLLDAQSKGAGAIPSTTLASEYERQWGALKKEIEDDEARNSK